jgi:hypothetical protein
MDFFKPKFSEGSTELSFTEKAQIRSTPQKTKKLSEQNACFEVLKILGYLNSDASFVEDGKPNQLLNAGGKRKAEVVVKMEENHQTPAKQPLLDSHTEGKTELANYCAKHKLSGVMYETEPLINKTFISTVTVNGTKYTGSATRKKKEAEKQAAQVALYKLGVISRPTWFDEGNFTSDEVNYQGTEL